MKSDVTIKKEWGVSEVLSESRTIKDRNFFGEGGAKDDRIVSGKL
jgi:hypothetical protein